MFKLPEGYYLSFSTSVFTEDVVLRSPEGRPLRGWSLTWDSLLKIKWQAARTARLHRDTHQTSSKAQQGDRNGIHD